MVATDNDTDSGIADRPDTADGDRPRPETMRAVSQSRYGFPDVLELVDRHVPTPDAA